MVQLLGDCSMTKQLTLLDVFLDVKRFDNLRFFTGFEDEAAFLLPRSFDSMSAGAAEDVDARR